ncbi:MAG TPA: hypothetical protein VN843_14255, partial [Anaerolineales bacterium]|nr:hypothetical protein [Anaerolineales bacterium]
SHPNFATVPAMLAGDQGTTYQLLDSSDDKWMLKKFAPEWEPAADYVAAIQSFVPTRSQFESGSGRMVLTEASAETSSYQTPEFLSWIAGTILMPHVAGFTWGELIRSITEGTRKLSKIERLLLCNRLSEAVDLLEASGLSHRDLSSSNVIIDPLNVEVSLIDWDSLYHKSFNQQPNATAGTDGYVAPFARTNGTVDPQRTWQERADRFALALLNTELLTVHSESKPYLDRGLFDQAELNARAGQTLFRIKNRLKQLSPRAATLLESALNAASFDLCPSPVDWLAVIDQEMKKGAESVWSEEEIEDSVPTFMPKYEPHFVEIDKAAFVTIDPGVFVKAPGRRQH